MSQRFFGLLQILQRCVVIGLVLGQVTVGLRFLEILFFGACVARNLLEEGVGFGKLAVAHPGHCLLHGVGEPVRLVMGVADCLVVLHSRLLLVAHQGVGIA